MIAMIADPAQRHEGGAGARNEIGPDPMDPGRCGSRDWIRTSNRPINSRMLCR